MEPRAAYERAEELDEILAGIVRDHPRAIIAAVSGDGVLVGAPRSAQLAHREVTDIRASLGSLEPSSLMSVVEAWATAKELGTASSSVTRRDGTTAACHFVDVRATHGVLMVVIVSDGNEDPVRAEQPVLPPKSGHMIKDGLGTIESADDRVCQMLGYEPDDLVGRRSLEIIHPDDHPRAIDSWLDMLAAPPGATSRVRVRHQRADGSWLWTDLANTSHLDADEPCVLAELIDIADEMAALEAVRDREHLLTRLAEALPSGIVHVDADRKVLYSNDRLRQIIGAEARSLIEGRCELLDERDGDSLEALITSALSQGSDGAVEIRLSRVDGDRPRTCAVTVRALVHADGSSSGAVVCVDDITDASALRAELQRRATIDELTGCLNRSASLSELERNLRQHVDGSRGTGVVFVDLDEFKNVNDTFGHRAGDELLRAVAHRLHGTLRHGDVLGRLGGDEFVVIVHDVEDARPVAAVGERLRDALRSPFQLVAGLPVTIGASVGIAWSGTADAEADALLAAADRAMYAMKRGAVARPMVVERTPGRP